MTDDEWDEMTGAQEEVLYQAIIRGMRLRGAFDQLSERAQEQLALGAMWGLLRVLVGAEGRRQVSEKETCPVCDSYSSHMYRTGECPNGCPVDLQMQVSSIRNRVADDRLKSELIEARKAESEWKEKALLYAARLRRFAQDLEELGAPRTEDLPEDDHWYGRGRSDDLEAKP